MAKTKRTTVYLSRDTGSDELYFWGVKPRGAVGVYGNDGDIPAQSFDVGCEALEKMSEALGVPIPGPGQLIRLSISVTDIEQLETRESIAGRLRKAKRFDKALMATAAEWIEAVEDDEGDDEDEPDDQ